MFQNRFAVAILVRYQAPDLPVEHGGSGIADTSTDPGSGALMLIVVRVLGEREGAMGRVIRPGLDKR